MLDGARAGRAAGYADAAMTTPQLLTVAEVADLFRVSSMTVYRLIRNGELPAVRVGRSYRVTESDLQAYLEAQVVDPGEVDLTDASQG